MPVSSEQGSDGLCIEGPLDLGVRGVPRVSPGPPASAPLCILKGTVHVCVQNAVWRRCAYRVVSHLVWFVGHDVSPPHLGF